MNQDTGLNNSGEPDNNVTSYEQARDRLQEILQKLQEPSQSLETSLKLWEEGRALVEYCEEVLQNAMKRLDCDEGVSSGDEHTQNSVD